MKSGADQFRNWMARRWPNSERPQRDTAEHFGWDETFVTKLVNGKRLPGLTNALKIERETGIPCEAWESSGLDKQADPVGANSRKALKGQHVRRGTR